MNKQIAMAMVLSLVGNTLPTAYADEVSPYSQYSNPMGVSPGVIQPDAFPEKNINPEQVCAAVKAAMDKVVGSDSEKAYCARREIPLDPFAIPSGMPSTTDGSWAEGGNLCQFATNDSCPIRIKQCLPDPGVGVTPDWTTASAGETCKEAQQKINSCKYARIGSDKQVGMYCTARYQASKGKKALTNMAILDGTAAAMCAADCFNPNESLRKASQLCGIAALGAGAQEFIQISRMVTGNFGQKRFSGDYNVGESGVVEKQTPAVAMLATKVAGGYTSGKAAITGYKMASEYYKTCDSAATTSNPNLLKDAMKADNKPWNKLGSKKSVGVKSGADMVAGTPAEQTANCQKAQRAVACSAMRTFGVLAGIRYFSMKKAKKTVDEADKAIYGMMGKTPPVTGKGANGNGSGSGGGLFGNNGGNNGSTTGGFASGSTSGSGSGSGWGNSADSGPLTFGAIDGDMTDGRMLQGPLGRKALDKAKASNWTEAKLDKAGSAAGLMSSIGGSMGLGSKMNELATIATLSTKEAGNGENSAVYASTGGAKHSGGAAESDPGLGLGMGEEAPVEGNTDMAFGRNLAEQEEDIWHTGSDQSIFQIVSKKYTKVNGRVEKK